MRRIGINPARDQVSEYKPARVTAAVLTYIPMLEGYFTERLDILRLCLGSLLQNTDIPVDLMVFDNGSCPEVGSYLRALQQDGTLRYLLRSSENIGKTGALKMIFGSAPGEVVAFCDDDVYYYPGWLEAHLAVLDHFPNTGMVSGVGTRVRFRDSIQSNLDFVERDPEALLHRGRFIPDEWEHDFCLSTGRDPEQHREDTKEMEDLVLEYRGQRAFAMANHFQFVSYRDVMKQALFKSEWTGKLMREMVALDQAVEELGYLRLSTIERTSRHMGNSLPENHNDLLVTSFERSSNRLQSGRFFFNFSRLILKLPGVRRVLEAIYHRIFLILNSGRIEIS